MFEVGVEIDNIALFVFCQLVAMQTRWMERKHYLDPQVIIICNNVWDTMCPHGGFIILGGHLQEAEKIHHFNISWPKCVCVDGLAWCLVKTWCTDGRSIHHKTRVIILDTGNFWGLLFWSSIQQLCCSQLGSHCNQVFHNTGRKSKCNMNRLKRIIKCI